MSCKRAGICSYQKPNKDNITYLDIKLDKDLQEQIDRPFTTDDIKSIIKEPFVPIVEDDEELFDLGGNVYLVFKKNNKKEIELNWNFTVFAGGGI